MKLLKILWAILPLILGCVVYFGYLRVLPTVISVVLFVLFAIAWFCREIIASVVVKKISEHTQLEASSTKTIKLIVKAAILVAFLGIPMLIYGIIAFTAGIIEKFIGACDIVFQDLTFVNGAGFFVFALFELLVTIGALAAVVFAIIKCRKNHWDKKNFWMVSIGAFLVQRIMSWFYFDVGVGGAIGEIIFWAVLIGIIFLFVKYDLIGKFRAWRKNRPIEADYEEVDDSDYMDPV